MLPATGRGGGATGDRGAPDCGDAPRYRRVQVRGQMCMGRAALTRYTAAPAWASAAGSETRSGPGRNSVPQMTAPALKMAAATQNPVVYPWISDIPTRDGAGRPWTRVAGLRWLAR